MVWFLFIVVLALVGAVVYLHFTHNTKFAALEAKIAVFTKHAVAEAKADLAALEHRL